MKEQSPLQIKAYHSIKKKILDGILEPDILYSETKLATEMGISRTPLREALRRLSQDGYIYIVPSKGFRIRQLNQDDMKETIEIRCAIEGFCVYTIAKERDSQKKQDLIEHLSISLEQQLKILTDEIGVDEFMDYDHQFHLYLIEYVENQEFYQLFQRLMYLIHLTTAKSLTITGRIEETLTEHQLIYTYLKQGNGEQAYQTMMNHLLKPLTLNLAPE